MKLKNKKENILEEQKGSYFDLEDRTFRFAKDTVAFLKGLPQTIANREFFKQLIRSSSSVGANYLEANNCLGKKDFCHKIGICRKEAKESNYWLKLIEIDENNALQLEALKKLQKESIEIMLIFGAILRNSRNRI